MMASISLHRLRLLLGALVCLVVLGPAAAAQAQAENELFFREDWAETPPEQPITQDHVARDGLTLHQYGPGPDCVKKSHHEEPPLDPYYVWSGRCEVPWAVTLRRTDAAVDLTAPGARIRWRSRPSGVRHIRVVLKTADGTWLVSEPADTLQGAWHEWSAQVRNLRWRRLDIERVTEASRVHSPDLSRVTEVGFTDLMRGGGSPASTRIDWVEVWGQAVPNARPE